MFMSSNSCNLRASVAEESGGASSIIFVALFSSILREFISTELLLSPLIMLV